MAKRKWKHPFNWDMKQYPPAIRVLFTLLLIIVIIYCLVKAGDVLQPLILGMLIAFLLYPLADKLEQWKIPRIAANLIVIVLSLGIMVGFFFLLVKLFTNFLDQLPEMKKQLLSNVNQFNNFLSEKLGISAEKQNKWIRERIENQLNNIGSIQFFSATTSTLLKIFLLPIYSFLFLYYRDKFKGFLLRMVGDHNNRWEKIVREISKITPRYLGGSLVVVLILAAVNSLGFWIIGLEQAILFGVVAAVLNFIPYLGTILGYMVVLIFALTTQGLGVALGVIIQFFIVQFTENNILTPNITGSRVRLNPFVVIVGIFAGGKIWGIVGMFVIVPLLAMLKVFFENTETLKPLSFLMSTEGTEKHSLSSKKIMRFLNRGWDWIKRLVKRWRS